MANSQTSSGKFYIYLAVAVLIITFFIFIFTKKGGDEVTNDYFPIDGGTVVTDNSVGLGEHDIPVFDKDVREISFIELSNSIFQNGGDNLKEKINLLKESPEVENKQKATFLESFVGDYKTALSSRETLCTNDTESDYCRKVRLNITSYLPKDLDGKALDNVNLYVDGRELGELGGKNTVEVENKFVHRVRAEKEGYLDFFTTIVVDARSSESLSFNPELVKASKEYSISTTTSNTFETDNFTFIVEPNSFINKDGTPFSGPAKVYLFDIGDNERDINSFNLDAFDENLSYAGGSMITFGMPLLKAYTLEGEELQLSKQITGRGKIQNPEKQPDMDLINVPKNVYLSRAELAEYNIPPFWNLDLNSGVWHEAPMKILDNDGTYEFIYN